MTTAAHPPHRAGDAKRYCWDEWGIARASRLANHEAMGLIVTAANPLGLPAGTPVEELSRREIWDHQGCIPSVRTLMVEVRLPSGEVREEVLEQGYADVEPWSGEPWLAEVR